MLGWHWLHPLLQGPSFAIAERETAGLQEQMNIYL